MMAAAMPMAAKMSTLAMADPNVCARQEGAVVVASAANNDVVRNSVELAKNNFFMAE
jgi:hypothetical protein